jgi:CubicO group peptidase (beta-lactamase class C family)
MRKRIESLLEEQVQAGLHPGACLYFSRKGEVLLDLSVGVAREEVPMKPETSLLWMSAGKPITAVAMMQQVERGLISLDERVASIIPEFGVRGKEGITLRHLLTHTGGFRLADQVDVMDWDQAIAEVCAVPLEPGWAVGEKAGYHVGGSWLILGELIQRLDGRAIEDYLAEEIFSVSGMSGCRVGNEGYEVEGSVMHLTEKGVCLPHPQISLRSRMRQKRLGGNMMGPARALGKFYEVMLSGGGELLSPETLQQMIQRERRGCFDHTFRHILDVGLGFIINSAAYGPQTVPYGYGSYASPESFGHGGNQSSIAFADPQHELVLVYLTNGMPGELEHQKRMRVVMDAVYEECVL